MSKILWFKECSMTNKHLVGGKCSSLGELYHLSKTIGFTMADGFAITTQMYDDFLHHNMIESLIIDQLNSIDYDNISELNVKAENIKSLFKNALFNEEQKQMITLYYADLCELYSTPSLDVAVRSSALAEDLPNASFAGQQDTFLNIKGIKDLFLNIKMCFASLFNGRAISYRHTHNIAYNDVKISVAIQKMVRSDLGSAGVAFSMDPESGYDKAIVINSAFGLGELVVSGGE